MATLQRIRQMNRLYIIGDTATIVDLLSAFHDVRETYYLPPDMWRRLMGLEVAQRRITAESATAWLAQYRGCVGTELYEYADQNPWIEPGPATPALQAGGATPR